MAARKRSAILGAASLALALGSGSGDAQTSAQDHGIPATTVPVHQAEASADVLPISLAREPVQPAPAPVATPLSSCRRGGPCRLPRGNGPGWKQGFHDHAVGKLDQFGAPPLGQTIFAHFQTHVVNGQAARMVLYHYDFQPGGSALNLRGKDRLAKIAARFVPDGHPIIIERILDNPVLGEARREAVLKELGQLQIPVSPDAVVVGAPPAIGLHGVEAELIYLNQLSQTQAGPSNCGNMGGPSGIAPYAAPPPANGLPKIPLR
jgi:hypothetical protein